MFTIYPETLEATFIFTDKNDASIKHTWSYAKFDIDTSNIQLITIAREIAKFFPDSTLTRVQTKETSHISLT